MGKIIFWSMRGSETLLPRRTRQWHRQIRGNNGCPCAAVAGSKRSCPPHWVDDEYAVAVKSRDSFGRKVAGWERRAAKNRQAILLPNPRHPARKTTSGFPEIVSSSPLRPR